MPRSEQEQVDAKVGNWKKAYDLVRPDMTVPGMRELLMTMQGDEGMRTLPLYIQLARLVSANDRASGMIAAMLVATGIKPVSIDFGDDA